MKSVALLLLQCSNKPIEAKWKMERSRLPVRYGCEWQKTGNGYSTQRPAIVAIGPAGENKSGIASLVHGGGSGTGQGGFAGVFGSKNLKRFRANLHKIGSSL